MQTSVTTRTLVSAGIVLVATMVVATRTESQASLSGPTEAPTGFVVESNGFAQEFCARQPQLVDSRNSPMIPDDECNFLTAARRIHRSRNRRRRPRADLQCVGLRRMSLDADPRRLQPDHGEARRLLRWRRVFRAPGRIPHPGSGDPAVTPGAHVAGAHQRHDASLVSQCAGRRIRRGDRQHHPGNHREPPAGVDAWTAHPGAGAMRGTGHAPAASGGRTNRPASCRSRPTPT